MFGVEVSLIPRLTRQPLVPFARCHVLERPCVLIELCVYKTGWMIWVRYENPFDDFSALKLWVYLMQASTASAIMSPRYVYDRQFGFEATRWAIKKQASPTSLGIGGTGRLEALALRTADAHAPREAVRALLSM